jgi:non-specific serine/threonine protein kinase
MNADLITAATVQQALGAIRTAGRLNDSPLLQLDALSAALTDARGGNSPTARAAFLRIWLEGITHQHLTQLRGGDAAPYLPRTSSADNLATLASDFRADNVDREAWGILHFHYFSGSSATRGRLADSVGVGYNTVRRRLERGCELLAASLREREREADANTAHGHNVPRPLTRLIGRETELGAIRALLAEHRLVVLTGPGGIGKSRLALHLAHDLAPDYPDGAWFVEMATVVDDRQVPQAVLTALGQREIPGRSHTDTVTAILAAQRPLLVVDNCEQVVAGCSSLLGHLLQRCRDLQVLATSREALHVAGAAHWSVPPLALPATDQAPSAGSLMHFDAPRLFNARAAVATPGFEMTDDNAAQVGDICARLDGIPLALELAAGRLRQLTLAQLDTRLADRFAVLRDGRHATRPSHETLRAMMDWSYDLLTAPEQQLYRRLAVFRGGCTLEAAEGVCSGDGVAADDVLELLDHLEAKSLLYVRDEAGARHFRMLETVREYALDRLTSAEEVARWRDRHLAHFEAIAVDMAPAILEPQRMDHAPWVAAEIDNFRAAMAWAAESHAEVSGARIASTLLPLWERLGLEMEGEAWLSQSLAAATDGWPNNVRADALYVLALLAVRHGDLDGAIVHADDSRANYEAAGNILGAAACDSAKGNVLRRKGRRLEAIELIQAARKVFMAANHRNGIANTAIRLAGAVDKRASLEHALELLGEGEAIYRELGFERAVAAAQNNRAVLFMSRGRLTDARMELERSLDALRSIGDTFNLSVALMNLSNVERDQGDYQAARRHGDESLRLGRLSGSPVQVGHCLATLSGVATAEHDDDAALRMAAEAVEIGRDNGEAGLHANGLIGLIRIELQLDRLEDARGHIAEGLKLADDLNYRGVRCAILAHEGSLHAMEGSFLAAHQSLTDSIQLARQLSLEHGLQMGLDSLIVLAAAEGRERRALTLAGMVESHQIANSVALTPREAMEVARILAPLRTALGATLADEALAVGRLANRDETFAYALGELTWDQLRDVVGARC